VLDTANYTQEQLDTIVAEALRRQRATAQTWQERYDQLKHYHHEMVEWQKHLRLLFEALTTALENNKQVVAAFEEQRLKLEDQLTALRRWSHLSGTPMAP
jgi:hypothetical protein